jgi:hypothetical protein
VISGRKGNLVSIPVFWHEVEVLSARTFLINFFQLKTVSTYCLQTRGLEDTHLLLP